MQIENFNMKELINSINDVRDLLNEISITMDEDKNKQAALKLSEYLDKLIVEYMKNIETKG
ncbi:Spo0E family sporulation regulatory protein-aspartic acid phosphatase [Clostridium bowmanii]|uniref:Spo0E family sporulation regulatory protein-aspartic acid phosphatase n=1 Tax=Clostridium bowmanii TaxID=132925 RepID=UPI001C0DDF08|nr:Spo0E family sporulation regulatory protein-aspartic acid phosphatase [Clostridium bowmanii]MBU3191880.1 Spo0E family sporulation regulatory protein-aspartic acid phosphatase [Clostridium bowmanii]MCA1076128.1 Spo0E family sporulation regulatory protein-aspartic acid phosphatase [Clostridium bowmanii]